jgi:DNA invertase Pin-like site-specific DNA recombinase
MDVSAVPFIRAAWPSRERTVRGHTMGDVLGYARVSTGDQDVAGQTLRLEKAGALKVFTDVRSGKSMDRPSLEALLGYARKGDTLAVVRLDRLGRSLGELLAMVALLKERGIDLVSLEERIDTASAAGELILCIPTKSATDSNRKPATVPM